jgi:hypothetical protein
MKSREENILNKGTHCSKTTILNIYNLYKSFIIDNMSNIVENKFNIENKMNFKISGFTKKNEYRIINDIKKIENEEETTNHYFKNLELEFWYYNELRIRIEFNENGNVKFEGESDNELCQTLYNSIIDEIKLCDLGYNFIISKIINNQIIKIGFVVITIFFAFLLLVYSLYYLIALEKGVNLDTKILPNQNTYYQDLETAIKSDSTNLKLDFLLKSNLKDFTNATIVIQDTKTLLKRLLIIEFALIFIYLIIKILSYYFSLTFFSLNKHHLKKYQQIEKKRDIWLVSIIIGFIINILASIFVAILI